jgi:hypothetical protein
MFSKKDQAQILLKEFQPGQVKYFPMVSDFFIRSYVPETDTKEAKEANPSLMEILVQDFCQFLQKLKLTNIRVTSTREVRIDFKPPIAKPKLTPSKTENLKEKYIF